jgi:hypothetical protein
MVGAFEEEVANIGSSKTHCALSTTVASAKPLVINSISSLMPGLCFCLPTPERDDRAQDLLARLRA